MKQGYVIHAGSLGVNEKWGETKLRLHLLRRMRPSQRVRNTFGDVDGINDGQGRDIQGSTFMFIFRGLKCTCQ